MRWVQVYFAKTVSMERERHTEQTVHELLFIKLCSEGWEIYQAIRSL